MKRIPSRWHRGRRATLPSLALAAVCLAAAPWQVRALGSVNVLTRNYDNARTGANLSETVLRQSNVNASQFGKLFQLPVDDGVYAQILYASSVPIAGGTRNVIYVATVNNSVYAFDADTAGAPLWQRNFNGSGRPTRNTEVGSACGTYRDFTGNIGIIGTPVIDGGTSTMYFVTRTVEGTSTVQRLRAVDITTGADRAGSPVVIAGSVAGTGEGSVNGTIAFNPATQNQRPALALASGHVYIGWASFCDTHPYHGWVISYDAATLARVGVFNATPNGNAAGIWMAGGGPTIDASGDLYVPTGNGTFTAGVNFGESVLKLSPGQVSRLDSFTPSDWSGLNSGDLDLGSAGTVLLPGTNLLVAGGKGGKGYLLNAASLGGNVAGDTQIPQVWSAVDTTVRPNNTHHIHNSMVAWNAPQGLNVYVWGENDFARIYRFNPSTQKLNIPAAVVGSVLPPIGMPGGIMSLSANGSGAGTGVLWVSTPRAGDANQAVVPGILYALNAETLAQLWSSTGVGDDTYNMAKGTAPVVANGKVYVASLSNVVSVYGTRTTPPPSQNLALNKTATGSTACNTDEAAAKAVNGSWSGGNTDKWCSTATGTKFLQVDLGQSMSVGQIVIEHAGAGGEPFSLNTKDYNVQLSTDGTAFTPVATVTGNIQSITTHNIPATQARFVRLNVVTPTQTTDAAARIYELQVYGGGPSVPSTIQYEAEALTVAGFTSGRVERVALDAGYSGGQGVILEGHAATDFLTFTANVPEARTYDVRVRIKRLGNRGIFQFDSNGTNLGAPVDGFAAAASFPEIDLGNMTFASAGNKAFRFTLTGKNATSTDFWLAIDYIKLIPQ
jgi:hypothetical protein